MHHFRADLQWQRRQGRAEMGRLFERWAADFRERDDVRPVHRLVQHKYESLVRRIHLQETQISRLKDSEPSCNSAISRSLARFPLRLLSVLLHGIPSYVLRKGRKFHRPHRANIINRLLRHTVFLPRQIGPALKRHEKLQKALKESLPLRAAVWFVMKIYTFVFMGYSLIPFVFLSASRYTQVFGSIYYCGHVIFLSYPLAAPYIKKALRSTANSQPSTHQD